MENKEEFKKINWQKWLTIVTPCTIVGAAALIEIFWCLYKLDESEGWTMLGVILFLPLLIGAIIVHFIIGNVSEWKVKTIWIAEGIVSMLSILIYWYQLYRQV